MSTGRPSFSQVRLGGGMPLEMHSRVMDLWRITERSAGLPVRMDGGTRKVKRAEELFSSLQLIKKKELQKFREEYLPKLLRLWGVHLKHKLHLLQ